MMLKKFCSCPMEPWRRPIEHARGPDYVDLCPRCHGQQGLLFSDLRIRRPENPTTTKHQEREAQMDDLRNYLSDEEIADAAAEEFDRLRAELHQAEEWQDRARRRYEDLVTERDALKAERDLLLVIKRWATTTHGSANRRPIDWRGKMTDTLKTCDAVARRWREFANSTSPEVAEVAREIKKQLPFADYTTKQMMSRWADRLEALGDGEPFRCVNCHEPNAPALCHFCRDKQDDDAARPAPPAEQSDELMGIVEEVRESADFMRSEHADLDPHKVGHALDDWADRLSSIADKGECGGLCPTCGGCIEQQTCQCVVGSLHEQLHQSRERVEGLHQKMAIMEKGLDPRPAPPADCEKCNQLEAENTILRRKRDRAMIEKLHAESLLLDAKTIDPDCETCEKPEQWEALHRRAVLAEECLADYAKETEAAEIGKAELRDRVKALEDGIRYALTYHEHDVKRRLAHLMEGGE